MRRVVIAAIVVSSGCGGSVASVDEGGPGVDAGVDATSDAPADAADARTDTGAGDGGYDCTGKLAQLDAIAQATRKCCPTCNTAQCTIAVKGLCCPISASSASAAKLMEQAIADYVAHCPPVACPATPCAIAPSSTCDLSTSLCQ